MLSRLFGLTCDQLMEVEMVQACGKFGAKLIRANEQENSNLLGMPWWRWWKLRIVTSLTFRVHPIKNVSIFSITWEWEDFIAAFQAWQNWAPYIDERLTSSIELFAKQRNKIEAQGEFVGSPLNSIPYYPSS